MPQRETMNGMIACVIAATACGAALGMWEILWILLHRTSTNSAPGSHLLLFGCISNGAICAVAASAFGLGARLTARGERVDARLGVGVAIGVMVALMLSGAVTALRIIQLWWIIPMCGLSGVTLGLGAFWLAGRLPWLQRPPLWAAANATALLFGLAFIGLQRGSEPLIAYGAVVVFVALLLSCLAWFFGSRSARWGRVAIAANAWLLLSCAALPLADEVGRRMGEHSPVASRGGVNVVVVSIDTLRADRLGAYGRPNAFTPNIDAFARTAVVFENAGSSMPLTGPSHTTMLTGLYPYRHRATTNGAPIAPDVRTIPEVFSEAGYGTAGFVSGLPLTDELGHLAGRFDYYDEDLGWRLGHGALSRTVLMSVYRNIQLFHHGLWLPQERSGAETTAAALGWLRGHGSRPFFLFVHYYDPHRPYAPSPAHEALHDPGYGGHVHRYDYPKEVERQVVANSRERRHVEALYAAEISDTDVQLGHLLRGIDSLGLADNTLVVLTSDHGESMTEHDSYFDHGDLLYEPTVHVPLLIRFPQGRHAGTRFSSHVRLVDLAPTILDVTGMRSSDLVMDGQSLLPLLGGDAVGDPRVGFGSVYSTTPGQFSRYYLRAGDYKLIWTFDHRRELSSRPGYEELFNLSTDPGERDNLVATAPPILETLRAELKNRVAAETERPTVPNAALRERLRALGYR